MKLKMSEDNKHIEFDDLMRSILSQGQEEVPAFVWEGVSSQLDRIEAAKVQAHRHCRCRRCRRRNRCVRRQKQ